MPSAALYIRVTRTNGSRLYAKALFSNNGRLKPHFALIDGGPEHHPAGAYHIRYTSPAGKRVWELAGSDPSLPAVALQRRSHALQGIALGLKVSEPGIAAPVIPSAAQQTDSTGQQHRMLSDCITSYLAETREHKAERTFLAYRETLGLFTLAVKREHIEDITREDMLAFGAFLKKRGMRRARSAIVSITLRSSCTISDYLRCSKGKYFPKYTEKQVRLPPYRVGSDVWPIDAGRV